MCICFWPEFVCPEVTLHGWQDIKFHTTTTSAIPITCSVRGSCVQGHKPSFEQKLQWGALADSLVTCLMIWLNIRLKEEEKLVHIHTHKVIKLTKLVCVEIGGVPWANIPQRFRVVVHYTQLRTSGGQCVCVHTCVMTEQYMYVCTAHADTRIAICTLLNYWHMVSELPSKLPSLQQV